MRAIAIVLLCALNACEPDEAPAMEDTSGDEQPPEQDEGIRD